MSKMSNKHVRDGNRNDEHISHENINNRNMSYGKMNDGDITHKNMNYGKTNNGDTTHKNMNYGKMNDGDMSHENMNNMKKPVLEVKNLSITFSQYTRGLRKKDLKVINNLDIELYEGEILAVVGSSGSGKSLLAHAVMGILPENSSMDGEMKYAGKKLGQEEKEKLRGKELFLIPQSVNYLDPLHTVGQQMKISLKGINAKKQKELINQALSRYDLPVEVENYYPHQLSGGMVRKVMLNMAMLSNAKVIIADEPTPGLDDKALKDVLTDFRKTADSGSSILMITHDINAALKIADKIAIFYAGTTLEVADTEDFGNGGSQLRHPYTKALFHALPTEGFMPIDGTQPYPTELPEGCLFSDRCSLKTEKCKKEVPKFTEVGKGKVRCIYASES